MQVILPLCQQVIFMGILMAIGYALLHFGCIDEKGTAQIGKILLYVVIPVVIVNSFLMDRTVEHSQALWFAFWLSVVAMGVSLCLSTVVFPKDGVAFFASAFSNAGFIGIPLIQAVLGDGSIYYVVMFIVFINALQWTYGVFRMGEDVRAIQPMRIMKNPIVIAAVLGLCLYLSAMPIPLLCKKAFSSIAALNTPLAMFLSGAYLAKCSFWDLFKTIRNYRVCLMRLVVIPMVTIVCLKFLPLGHMTLKLAIVIACSCPVGSNVAIFAQQLEKDYVFAVQTVCLSTLCSLLTLPLLVGFASLIF